ncbi:MAG: RidA family protein [Fimbriimonadaceae bacterium]|nr:RidA family protein [Fimbriimonadaceae bacterium]
MARQAGMAPDGPRAYGPYSHYNIANGFVFISGQGPIDPVSGEPSLGSIEHETRLTLQNLERCLRAAGTDLAHVVRCTVYLKRLEDFPVLNRVYAEFFPQLPPTRSTVGVDLLVGTSVEIDCIAVLPEE